MSSSELVKLLVGLLATWRLSSLLVHEDGPFNVFEKLRMRVGVYFTNSAGQSVTFWGGLLSCLWCTSVWVGTGVAVLLFTPWWPVLIPFALSTGAILIDGRT